MSEQIDNELLEKLRARIRIMSNSTGDEISDLVRACWRELELAGVYGDVTDPTYFQATVLYCKAHYGYDENTERFSMAFSALRDAMSLSGEYGKDGG